MVGSETPAGRWPANLILDEDAVVMLDAQSGVRRSAGDYPSDSQGTGTGVTYGGKKPQGALYSDSGGASRFFTRADDRADLRRWLITLVSPPNAVVVDLFSGEALSA
jgi:site-specific DNA-methyltransferase (adenine-specific)